MSLVETMTSPTRGAVKLLPAQKRYLESVSPAALYSGAFGAGKTRALCEKAYLLSTIYPGNRGLICRKSANSLTHTTLDVFFREVCPPEHIASYHRTHKIVTLKNGSEIIFSGLEDPNKIASMNLGWVGIDEVIETNEKDWRMLEGRLRWNGTNGQIPFRQIFGATNPGAPTHYLYHLFFKGKKGYACYQSNAEQNIFNPADYLERLQNFTGRYRDRYVLGLWVGFEGLIYDNLVPEHHFCDNFRIPAHWPIYMGVDFGYQNPSVVQWWARDDDGVYYRYKEFYKTHVTAYDLAEAIKANTNAQERRQLVGVWADHDAGDRAILAGMGVPTIPANKEVKSGITTVYRLLDGDKDVERGTHYPKIKFCRNALVHPADHYLAHAETPRPTCTEEELGGYTWASPKDGQPLREEPVKADDHGVDTMRMVFHSLNLPSRRTQREETVSFDIEPVVIGPDTGW